MVVQILLGLVLLLLAIALALALLIYVPLLPLLSQVLLLEAFGDPDAGTVLPAVTFVVTVAIGAYAYTSAGRRPSAEAAKTLALGVVFLTVGAAAFGDVWEVLELKHRYYAGVTNPFFRTSCADIATTCLTHDERSPYPDQLLPAIGAEIVWYVGAVAYARGLVTGRD